MPIQLVRTPDARVGGLRPREVVVELATHGRLRAASFLKAGLRVLAYRLELPKAGAERTSSGREQRLVDQ